MLCLSGYSRWVSLTNLVVSGQIIRGKKPNFQFQFRLFHTSSPLRSIELSVKTLNVMARARHSAKIKMGNGNPFHLDFTIMMCTNDLVFTALFENKLKFSEILSLFPNSPKFESRVHDCVFRCRRSRL